MVFPAYKFYKGDKSKYEEVIGYFEKAVELNGPDLYGSNLVAYMDLIRRYKLTGGDISDVEVIDVYTQITDILDAQMAEGKKVDRLEKIADNIDKLLTSTVDLNCDFVEEKLGPKLQETGDIKMAKKIFQLMLTGKCSDRPLAYEAAKIVHAEEPSFSIAKFLGIRAAQNDKLDEAEEFYNQAIELTDENTKKAEIFMNLARLDFSRGNKVSARANARKALAFDPTMSEAYSLIGDMYFGSQECQEKVSKVEDFAIYIAAYKMYQRAGDSEGMARAKQYFPTINDIFSEGYEEGQTIQVGCWINESVVLERRPEN
jgi:tetratricopeptide (TPR) repeat protein